MQVMMCGEIEHDQTVHREDLTDVIDECHIRVARVPPKLALKLERAAEGETKATTEEQHRIERRKEMKSGKGKKKGEIEKGPGRKAKDESIQPSSEAQSRRESVEEMLSRVLLFVSSLLFSELLSVYSFFTFPSLFSLLPPLQPYIMICLSELHGEGCNGETGLH